MVAMCSNRHFSACQLGCRTPQAENSTRRNDAVGIGLIGAGVKHFIWWHRTSLLAHTSCLQAHRRDLCSSSGDGSPSGSRAATCSSDSTQRRGAIGCAVCSSHILSACAAGVATSKAGFSLVTATWRGRAPRIEAKCPGCCHALHSACHAHTPEYWLSVSAAGGFNRMSGTVKGTLDPTSALLSSCSAHEFRHAHGLCPQQGAEGQLRAHPDLYPHCCKLLPLPASGSPRPRQSRWPAAARGLLAGRPAACLQARSDMSTLPLRSLSWPVSCLCAPSCAQGRPADTSFVLIVAASMHAQDV